MTTVVVTVALAAMMATVVLGAVAPYRRATAPALEPLADPLEDRRLALLVSLKDLQAARDTGAIEAEEYLRLRDDTETRMARVPHRNSLGLIAKPDPEVVADAGRPFMGRLAGRKGPPCKYQLERAPGIKTRGLPYACQKSPHDRMCTIPSAGAFLFS